MGYPLELHYQGGWLNSDSPGWFADYAALLASRFGDRIDHWITLNEPQIFVGLGHLKGTHAPGLVLPESDIARIIHHVLLAHGKGVTAIRENCTRPVSIGLAPAVGVNAVAEPFRHDEEVVAAARALQFAFDPNKALGMGSAFYSDPIFLGTYPEGFVENSGHALPKGWEQDMKQISVKTDFCGQNIYAARSFHARDNNGNIVCREVQGYPEGFPLTHFDWPVTPEALYWGPKFFAERYHIPIVITENGMSGLDWVDLDGRVPDYQRIDFTRRYLLKLRQAAEEGVDIAGYFHWSLLDNFEWAEGYKHRFGLIYVDYADRKRTIKESGHWYRTVIESNGQNLQHDVAL